MEDHIRNEHIYRSDHQRQEGADYSIELFVLFVHSTVMSYIIREGVSKDEIEHPVHPCIVKNPKH